MNKFTQYKDFYEQDFTIPIKALRGMKFNFKLVMTAVALFFISAVLVSVIAPGKQQIFGVQKIYVILGLGGLLIYLSTRIDTANYPFFFFIFSNILFFLGKTRKKAIVCFKEVEYPQKKIRYRWRVPYRDIIDTGKELIYKSSPLEGFAKELKGFTLWVCGATRIKYNPVTKKLKVLTGQFEKLQPKEIRIGSLRPVEMEIGEGEVKFTAKKGQIAAKYTPQTLFEEKDEVK